MAVPLASTTLLQSAEAPSMNVTVPVAVPRDPETLAVNITGFPAVLGLADEPSDIEGSTLGGGGVSVNVAVTDLAAFMVTLHAPVPVHAPLQPAKKDPASTVGVSATGVPELNDAAQVEPQSIPAGFDVTLPPPEPPLLTVS